MVVAGYTYSQDGDIKKANHGGADFWILKLDENGKIKWSSTFGGSGDEFANAIIQTADSGFIAVGSTTSNDSQVSNNHGGMDVWVIKIRENGTLEWQKTYGGSGDEAGYSIIKASDSGYIIAGYSTSNDKDIKSSHAGANALIIKIGDTGNLKWAKTFGGSDSDCAVSITAIPRGLYAFAGTTKSSDGDIHNHHMKEDVWVVEIKDTSLVWEKAYGGDEKDIAENIICTKDSHIVFLAFSTSSGDGDLIKDPGAGSAGSAWLVKLKKDLSLVTTSKDETKFSETKFSIYPNPVNDKLNIEIQNPKEGTIGLTDLNGRILLTQNINLPNTSLDISFLPKGMYLIRYQDKNGVINRTVVKE